MDEYGRMPGPQSPGSQDARAAHAVVGGAAPLAAASRLLEERLQALGADHPDTLATRANLAVARDRLGQRSEAVADLRAL